MIKSRHTTLIMIALILCYMMIFIDESGIGVTLAQIQLTFSLSPNSIHWIVNGYLLSFSALLLIGGKLCDVLGAKNSVTLGIILFAIFSFICGVSQNGLMLIIGRILQGVGASLVMPTMLVVLKQNIKEEDFGKTFGLILGFANFFYAFGPFIAGSITSFLGWRIFFLLNVPLSLISLLFVLSFVPNHKLQQANQFNDIRGAILFVLALTILIYLFMQISVWGITDYRILGLFVLTVLLFIFFVKTELKKQHPIVDVRLFQHYSFAAANLILFIACFCLSFFVFLALWLKYSLSFTAAMAGLGLLPASLCFIFMPRITGFWHDRRGARQPLLVGLLIVIAGFIWLGLTLGSQNYWLFMPGLILVGVGLPLVVPASVMLIMSLAPENKHGMVSAIFNTNRQFGLTMGIAVVGIITSRYTDYYFTKLIHSVSNSSNLTIKHINLALAGHTHQNVHDAINTVLLKKAQFIYSKSIMFSSYTILVLLIIAFILGFIFINAKE